MKKLATLLLVAAMSCGAAVADDAHLTELAAQLATQATAAVDAATAPEDMPACQRPPTIRNWRLRDNLKDIRTVALKLRDRAARGKGHTMVSRLKLHQIKANMQTCNFLVQNRAAEGLEAFPAAWTAARETICAISAELCTHAQPGEPEPPEGDKSLDEPEEAVEE